MKKIFSLFLFSFLFIQTVSSSELDPYDTFINDKIFASEQFDKVAKYHMQTSLSDQSSADLEEILTEAKDQLELSKDKIVKAAKKLIKEEDLETVENLVGNKDYQKHIINLTALNLMVSNKLIQKIDEAAKKRKTESTITTHEIIEITNENYVEKVLSNPRPVIVKAYADWCGPCKAIDGYYHEMNQAFGQYYQFASLNTDLNPKLTAHFGIQGIPHFMLIKNGQIVDQFSGANKTKLKDLIEKNLN